LAVGQQGIGIKQESLVPKLLDLMEPALPLPNGVPNLVEHGTVDNRQFAQ
jgi:hypothetical protein